MGQVKRYKSLYEKLPLANNKSFPSSASIQSSPNYWNYQMMMAQGSISHWELLSETTSWYSYPLPKGWPATIDWLV